MLILHKDMITLQLVPARANVRIAEYIYYASKRFDEC